MSFFAPPLVCACTVRVGGNHLSFLLQYAALLLVLHWNWSARVTSDHSWLWLCVFFLQFYKHCSTWIARAIPVARRRCVCRQPLAPWSLSLFFSKEFQLALWVNSCLVAIFNSKKISAGSTGCMGCPNYYFFLVAKICTLRVDVWKYFHAFWLDSNDGDLFFARLISNCCLSYGHSACSSY